MLQPKLQIGRIDSPLEREADAVADAITQDPAPAISIRPNPGEMISRACAKCEEDETLQAKAEGASLSRVDVYGRIQAARGKSGSPLGAQTRNVMESSFGADFSGVRIHTDSTASNLAKQISARAFTVGSDIFFKSGEYRPQSPEGNWLLAHELTHTVQQASVGLQVQRAPEDEEVKCPRRKAGERKEWDNQKFQFDPHPIDWNFRRTTLAWMYTGDRNKVADSDIPETYKKEYEENKPRAWIFWNFKIGDAKINKSRGTGGMELLSRRAKPLFMTEGQPEMGTSFANCWHRKLLIVGNSDCHGTVDINLGLNAERRNSAIDAFFRGGNKVLLDTNEISGLSSYFSGFNRRPTNDATPEDRAKNRSVVIYEVIDRKAQEECKLASQENDQSDIKAYRQSKAQVALKRYNDGWWEKIKSGGASDSTLDCTIARIEGLKPALELAAQGKDYSNYTWLGWDEFLTGEKFYQAHRDGLTFWRYSDLYTSSVVEWAIDSLANASDYDDFVARMRRLADAMHYGIAIMRRIKNADYVEYSSLVNWMHRQLDSGSSVMGCLQLDYDEDVIETGLPFMLWPGYSDWKKKRAAQKGE